MPKDVLTAPTVPEFLLEVVSKASPVKQRDFARVGILPHFSFLF